MPIEDGLGRKVPLHRTCRTVELMVIFRDVGDVDCAGGCARAPTLKAATQNAEVLGELA